MVSLTVLDQGASSFSNFLLSVLVAHASNARGIGVFAIVMTTYILCQGLVRSVSSDCLLTQSGAAPELRSRFERSGYLFALLGSCALSLVVLGIAAAIGGSFAAPLAIFAVCFPLMALQDFSRYIGISRQDPAYAIRLDVAWIIAFIIVVVGLHAKGYMSLPWLFGAWTATGAVVGLWTAPTFLSSRKVIHKVRWWMASEWSVGTRFAGQFLVGTFGAYGVLYLLVLVISIDAIGLFKVIQLALAPVVVLFAGVQSALVSIVSKKMLEDRKRATRFLDIGAVAMTVTLALWTVAVYVAPPRALSSLFGSSWVQARPYMLWFGFATALSCISAVYLIGLRAMRSAKELLRLVIIMAPFLLILPLVGGEIDGIRGVAVASGTFYVINAVLAWVIFTRAMKRAEAEGIAGQRAEGEGAVTPGDLPPLLLPDVLAREGLVEPISFHDMFAHRQAASRPVLFADMMSAVQGAGGLDGDTPVDGVPPAAGPEETKPIPFADMMSAVQEAGGLDGDTPVDGDTPAAGPEETKPIPFADLVARHQAVESPLGAGRT